jgi:hypothetical protein
MAFTEIDEHKYECTSFKACVAEFAVTSWSMK